MEHKAYLSRDIMEVGASLFILGVTINDGDCLNIDLPSGATLMATVSDFSLGKLLVTSENQLSLEFRTWAQGDEDLQFIPRPSSRWNAKVKYQS